MEVGHGLKCNADWARIAVEVVHSVLWEWGDRTRGEGLYLAAITCSSMHRERTVVVVSSFRFVFVQRDVHSVH